MSRLTLSNCVRVSAQLISLGGAVFGVFSLYLALIAMLEFDAFGIYFGLFCLAVGLCLIRVAYVMIWRYSLGSVKLFSFVAAIFVHTEVDQLFRSHQDAYLEQRMMLAHSLTMLAPVLLGVACYFACKGFLVWATELKTDPPRTPAVSFRRSR